VTAGLLRLSDAEFKIASVQDTSIVFLVFSWIFSGHTIYTHLGTPEDEAIPPAERFS
jgi:hypothetical protein